MSSNLSTEGQTTPQLEAASSPTPSFGWTAYAEKINGRFAMVGFAALLITEWLAQQDFFTWIGLR